MSRFSFSNKYNNPYSNEVEERKNHSDVKVINNERYSCNTIIITSKNKGAKREKSIKLKAVDEWVR